MFGKKLLKFCFICLMVVEPSMSTTLESQIKQQMQELSVQMNILLTNDIYSLRKDFLELSSNTSESIDGKKRSYFEHREYIHKKSLDLFDSINKHEKIPEASSFERGIIMYALQSAHKSSSLYSKSMEDRVRELKKFKKLEEKAIECMRGTNENLYTQTNLVAFLTTLCTLINQDKYKDDYRMASNADMYNTLLLGETNRLIQMINTVITPESKQEAFLIQQLAKKLLRKLGIINSKRNY